MTGSLHAFQKAAASRSGRQCRLELRQLQRLGCRRRHRSLSTTPGADDMGVLGWDRFRSSKPDIIKHENLVFQGKPEFNTKVTVDSYLKVAEKYGRYAERYPDDATFKKLAGTAVSATFTVMGTTGKDAPTVTATASLVGIDTTGAPETWSSVRSYSLAPGSTAADATKELLTASGLSADYANDAQGFVLNSVTSPSGGRTLGADALTGKRWQLFVNGEASTGRPTRSRSSKATASNGHTLQTTSPPRARRSRSAARYTVRTHPARVPRGRPRRRYPWRRAALPPT